MTASSVWFCLTCLAAVVSAADVKGSIAVALDSGISLEGSVTQAATELAPRAGIMRRVEEHHAVSATTEPLSADDGAMRPGLHNHLVSVSANAEVETEGDKWGARRRRPSRKSSTKKKTDWYPGKGLKKVFEALGLGYLYKVKTTSGHLAQNTSSSQNMSQQDIDTVSHAVPFPLLKSLGWHLSKGLGHMQEVFHNVSSKVAEFGALVVDVVTAGASVVDAAVGAFQRLMATKCVDFDKIMCLAFMGDFADCAAGSRISIVGGSNPSATVVVVPQTWTKAMVVQTVPNVGFVVNESAFMNGIEGRNATPEVDLNAMMWDVPEGLPLAVAVHGECEFLPTMSVEVEPESPIVRMNFSGLVYAGLDVAINSSRNGTWEKTIMMPETHAMNETFCILFFCVEFRLQGRVKVEVNATGAGGIMARAQFYTKAYIEMNLTSGQVTYELEDSEVTHENDVDMGSIDGVVQLSIGPVLSVLPVPGAPSVLAPTLRIGLTTMVEDDDSNSSKAQGGALNLYASTTMDALGLPDDVADSSLIEAAGEADNIDAEAEVGRVKVNSRYKSFRDNFAASLLKIAGGLANATAVVVGDCLSPEELENITGPLQAAAEASVGTMTGAIENSSFDFPLPTSLVNMSACENIVQKSEPPGNQVAQQSAKSLSCS